MALAQSPEEEVDALPSWYLGLLGGYVVPDSARLTDNGINAQVVLGVLLDESVGIEFNAFGQQTARVSDGVDESSYGGGLDLTLGVPERGSPFFLIGGGAISEKVSTVKKTSGYGNLGLGIYMPFSFYGELWRLEGRYNAIFNDESVPTNELLEDARFNLGFLFQFGELGIPGEPEDEAPLPPTRDVAIVDQDEDGIADAADLCPDTPRGAHTDAQGCPPASELAVIAPVACPACAAPPPPDPCLSDVDLDGIADCNDACPATSAGESVGNSGCALPQCRDSDPDADADGVPDCRDACPRNASGLKTDAQGCVVMNQFPISVSLDVKFEFNSSEIRDLFNVELARFRQLLIEHPELSMELDGHADAVGSAEYNLKLSEERARAVRAWLLSSGEIDSPRIRLHPYGKSQPIASNDTEAGRAQNRRVVATLSIAGPATR